MYDSLQHLTPHDDAQRSLKAEALSSSVDISKTLWLMSAERETAIATPMLIMVIVWLAITFLSFGLFAPANKTVIVTLLVVALSVSSAIYLIMRTGPPVSRINSESPASQCAMCWINWDVKIVCREFSVTDQSHGLEPQFSSHSLEFKL